MDENLSTYRGDHVVRGYFATALEGLTVPEGVCLELVPPDDRGSVLDIGVGAGRTTGPLAERFGRYIGIDYSPELVEAARSRFPGKDLQVMDARQLSFNEKFDCVMFSYNGIDYVNFKDRQLIFRQVVGALRSGGYFLYSTHSLDYRRARVWIGQFWVAELINSRSALIRPWLLFRRITSRLRWFKRQSIDRGRGVAYVNDPGLGFSLITTYVSVAKEVEALRRCGLRVLLTVGNVRQAPGYDENDNWVYILAKKDDIEVDSCD